MSKIWKKKLSDKNDPNNNVATINKTKKLVRYRKPKKSDTISILVHRKNWQPIQYVTIFESWHRREVDLVHGFPFVCEFSSFGKVMSDPCWRSCYTLSDGKINNKNICFRGFLLSGKLWVIHVEDHAAHCLMARGILIITIFDRSKRSLNVCTNNTRGWGWQNTFDTRYTKYSIFRHDVQH